MGDDHLFPYATTSRLKPWKTRIFVFASTAEAPPDLAPWPVQVPPHSVWPAHLTDQPRQDFFDWFTRIETTSVAQVIKGFSLAPDAIGDPVVLDKIGDRILELIAFSPEAEKDRQKRIKKHGEGMPFVMEELMWMPIWNSIQMDLAHFVGAGVKTVYAKGNPRWGLIDPKYRPFDDARFPAIFFNNPKTDPEDLDEEAFFVALVESDLSFLDEPERWWEIVEPELERRGHNLDEVDYTAFEPRHFLRPLKGETAFGVFAALKSFFIYALMKRYDYKDPYGYEEGLRSLGDILRPRDQPGWVGFPDLNL